MLGAESEDRQGSRAYRSDRRREASVYAQELVVHDGGQWKGIETVHHLIIQSLGVFLLAYGTSTTSLPREQF
jgi:hypothetical protein